MKKKSSISFIAIVILSFISNESLAYSKTYLEDSLLAIDINYILEKFDENTAILSLNEKNAFLDSIGIVCISNKDTNTLYKALIKKIDCGERSVLILEDLPGRYLRNNSELLYRQLEQYLSKSFIKYCLEFYPNINFELTFFYRHLFRMDQRFKLMAQDFRDNKSILDSLRFLSQTQDSITESVLENLFCNYGIPSFADVGPESNNLMIFLAHLSPDFVFRHISTVQMMILNHDLFTSTQSFEFVVDKALHRKYGFTIYYTIWNKHSPKINDEEELKKIKTTLRII